MRGISALLNFGRTYEALSAAFAVAEFDLDGKILDANPNFCRALGYERSEIVGQKHRIFMPPGEAEAPAYAEFWRRLTSGEPFQSQIQRIGKGGRRVWLQACYSPVRNAAGRVVRVVKVATDVSEAWRVHATLKAKLAAISRVQAIIEFTPTGEVIDANENFLELLGYRLDEIKGRHHRMFVDPAFAASDDYDRFWRDLNAGRFLAGDFKRIGKNGKTVWI